MGLKNDKYGEYNIPILNTRPSIMNNNGRNCIISLRTKDQNLGTILIFRFSVCFASSSFFLASVKNYLFQYPRVSSRALPRIKSIII